MVYQFMFDVFLFNTQFSELQYWGIGITVLTFVLDIYLTMTGPPCQDQPSLAINSSEAPAVDQKNKIEDESVL